MKKLMKLSVLTIFCASLAGCTQTKENTIYTGTYYLEYFSVESCPRCEDFEEETVPLIQEEFKEHMVITKYNLDDKKTKEHYDEVLENIEGFNIEEDYGYGPFVVLDGYFAKLGITSGDGEEFIKDIQRAIQGEELGDELSKNRYLFKDTSVE